jgi:hypothetical protein
MLVIAAVIILLKDEIVKIIVTGSFEDVGTCRIANLASRQFVGGRGSPCAPEHNVGRAFLLLCRRAASASVKGVFHVHWRPHSPVPHRHSLR